MNTITENKKKLNKTNLQKQRNKRKHNVQQQHCSTTQVNDLNTHQATNTDTTSTWGNHLKPKDPSMICLVLQNIGGIDMAENGSIKLAALQSFMQSAQVDICALPECNVAWNKAPPHLYPAEQMRYWWEACHWSLSHNQQETNEAAYQPGGAGIVVVNQLAHRAQRPGDDKIGLGRWCWARLRGKNNKIL